ncbi:hypothetical protein [uncultured Psychrobacter sp.]|uniref:hypothetical protein n=1 Tax=uncultured Psychrobacter sp. TaxID=259303 RepID=UPI002593D4FD|nr:hypothetical protein [uncultured Psychrobacter sp.]
MRTVTICKLDTQGRLYGEILEDGTYYTIEAFENTGSDLEQALMDRLDVLLVEWQFEAEMEAGQ